MKYCPQCGYEMADETKFCTNCGAALKNVASVSSYNSIEQQPVTPPPTNYQTVQQQNYNAEPLVNSKKKNSGLAITAFVLSFTFSILGFILAIVDLVKNKDNKHGLSIAALIISGLIMLIAIIGLSSSGSSSGTTKTSLPKTTSQVQLSESEKKTKFINSCNELGYKDVAREPDSYKGKNVKIEGKVLQVYESLGSTILRVATSTNGYDDIWYVTYKPASGEKRILEDDRIAVYGVCNGVETYTGVLGNKITIPALKASYIDIAELSEPEYTMSILRFDIRKETYGDDYEYYAIVEINNTGASNLYIKDSSFDIEDSSGHLIKTDDFSVSNCPNVLKPGETGYLYTSYAITLDGVSNPDGLVLIPKFTAMSVHDTPTEYDVSDVSVTDGSFGVKTVGRVTNNSAEENSYLYVTIVYYGKDKQILGICGTSVTGLEPGKTVSFEISGISMDGDFSANDVAYYAVYARDSYYAW